MCSLSFSFSASMKCFFQCSGAGVCLALRATSLSSSVMRTESWSEDRLADQLIQKFVKLSILASNMILFTVTAYLIWVSFFAFIYLNRFSFWKFVFGDDCLVDFDASEKVFKSIKLGNVDSSVACMLMACSVLPWSFVVSWFVHVDSAFDIAGFFSGINRLFRLCLGETTFFDWGVVPSS